MDEFLKSALEIAKAQAGVRPMTEEQLAEYVQNTAARLRSLATGENLVPCAGVELPEVAPEEAKKSIREKTITCLVCGKKMKVLTKRHLDSHGITPEEYRENYGFKKNTPLVAKELIRQRKEKMQEMRLWERRKDFKGDTDNSGVGDM